MGQREEIGDEARHAREMPTRRAIWRESDIQNAKENAMRSDIG